MGLEQSMVAPFLAFDLDPLDPLVYLVTKEVADFFAPSKGQHICEIPCLHSWSAKHHGPKAFEKIIGDDPKFEFIYIGSACIRFIKHVSHTAYAYKAQVESMRAQQQAFKESDAEMTAPGENGQTKKNSEWVSSARSIAEDMWQRFQVSGEDNDGDMDDESWTLIG